MGFAVLWAAALLLFLGTWPFSARAERFAGAADHMPWSGYWWPLNQGELVFGYDDRPSPLDKYDLYVQGTWPGTVSTWGLSRANNVYNPAAPYWHGYCNTWANAALLEQFSFEPSEHDGVRFEVGDKKGLITLCHRADQVLQTSCASDPSEFHRYLLQYIGDQGIGVAADLDPGEEIWSYPIFAYDMTVTEGSLSDTVVCTISYADDFVHPDFQGTKVLSTAYTYRLDKNDTGDYTGGEWLSYSAIDHPQTVWIPIARISDAPLDYELVKSIALGEDPEQADPGTPSSGNGGGGGGCVYAGHAAGFSPELLLTLAASIVILLGRKSFFRRK